MQQLTSQKYIVKFRVAARSAAGNPPAIEMAQGVLGTAGAAAITGHVGFTSAAFASFVVIDAPAHAAAALSASPHVEFVMPDIPVYASAVSMVPLPPGSAPPPPSAGGVRGGRRLASRTGWNPALDRLDQRAGPIDGVFNFYAGPGDASTPMDGAGVDVYVLDSGIRFDHDEFVGHIETSMARNFVNDVQGYGSTNATDACIGHGTFVASQIAGNVLGSAPGVRLIPIRIFACNGAGSYSVLLAAIDYIVTTAPTTGRKSIVNFSGAANGSPYYDLLADRLMEAGAPLIDAGGNDGVNACMRSPARSPASFTVGASDANDGWASFSNYGACINLTAVGVDNIGAWHTDAQAYAQGSGTSFATPLVAGLAATIWGALPANAPWSTVTGILTAASTAGRLTSLPPNTPNLLAYSGPVGGLAELMASRTSTPSITPSASGTPSITPSASGTPSITPSASATASVTPSPASLTATPTGSDSPTAAATRSRTAAATPSRPASRSRTASRTRSRVVKTSPSRSKSRSQSRKVKPRMA
jgi:aqualysin 1